MTNVFLQLDAQLDRLFAGWNIWSTTLVVILIAVLFSPLFFNSEPDLHPFLLARQASPSPVRESGQSAVYRSLDVPHGYPLRSGLNIKDENSSKWGPGRDGDMRDIWRSAAKAGYGKAGKILTLRGNNEPVTSTFEELSRQINIIGSHLTGYGGKRVAIFLPNSTEFLVTLFACVFYGLTPILIPPEISSEQFEDIARETQADSIIAPAGVISSQDVTKAIPHAKLIIWVVQESSQHLDFVDNSKASGIVSEWHSVIHAGSGENELPLDADAKNAPNIISVWQVKQNSHRVIEYTQANIIASVAAQLAALPRNHTIQETDLLISLESLTQSYPLTIVLAGLYAHASIALTSVAGLSSDYNMAFQGGLKPTIIIVSSTIMIKAHAELLKANESFLRQLHKSRKASHLAAGTMRVVDKQSPHLIYVSYSGNDTSLSLQDLNDLRIFTDSRIIHSLTSPQVAGAIVQTSPLDYRIGSTSKKSNHFGGPLSCVEIKVIEGESKISDEDYQPTGQLVVSGSAVIGKQEIKTGITAKFGDDHTLQLI